VVAFVKEHGARIRETGVKLMAPEACGMSAAYTDPVLNDPGAFGQTDIIAGHLYQGFVKKEESNYVKNRHDYIVGLYNQRRGKREQSRLVAIPGLVLQPGDTGTGDPYVHGGVLQRLSLLVPETILRHDRRS